MELVEQVHKVQLVKKEQQELKVFKVQLDQLVEQVHKVQLVKKVQQELKVQ